MKPIDRREFVRRTAVAGSAAPRRQVFAGYPSLAVPAGFVRGLPTGISFMGAVNPEPTLMRLADAFGRAAPARRAPTFAATASLP